MGVFDKVIKALRELNLHGYGMKNSGLYIDIVHNPVVPIFQVYRRHWKMSTTSVF